MKKGIDIGTHLCYYDGGQRPRELNSEIEKEEREMERYDFTIFYRSEKYGNDARFFATYADAEAEALNSATAFAEMKLRTYRKGFTYTIREERAWR